MPAASNASRPSAGDLLEGTRYRTVGVLGKGGMGTVFQAEHVDLRKRFAVKVLHAEMAKHPRLVNRLLVEAQTLARVNHLHLVSVHDIGQRPRVSPTS